MVINWDLSPSSATNTTPKADECGGEHSPTTFRRVADGRNANGRRTFGRRSRPPLPRLAGRAVRQYVDTAIGGYSPSLTGQTITTTPPGRQSAAQFRAAVSRVSAAELRALKTVMRQGAWPRSRCRDG